MPNPKIALSPPKPAAAKLLLTVPTPVVSVATTPELETKLVIFVSPLDVAPNPNKAFCVPLASSISLGTQFVPFHFIVCPSVGATVVVSTSAKALMLSVCSTTSVGTMYFMLL